MKRNLIKAIIEQTATSTDDSHAFATTAETTHHKGLQKYSRISKFYKGPTHKYITSHRLHIHLIDMNIGIIFK